MEYFINGFNKSELITIIYHIVILLLVCGFCNFGHMTEKNDEEIMFLSATDCPAV